MQSIPSVAPAHQTLSPDESILVVKRTHLFGSEPCKGFKLGNLDFLRIIQTHKEFLPRQLMENDPTYKQIIPYLIFTHNDRYFLMQRSDSSRETRLHNKLTLGIGGHVRQTDVTNHPDDTPDIFAWAKREFEEEIDYRGTYTVCSLGIVNDDSTPVSQVHVGLVLLLEGDSDQIQIKSELKSGKLVSLTECQKYYQHLETWSQLVLDFLVRTKT